MLMSHLSIDAVMLCGQVMLFVFVAQVRAISPPRCPANRDPADVSRIDAGRCSGGSFLMLAFKNTSSKHILLQLYPLEVLNIFFYEFLARMELTRR